MTAALEALAAYTSVYESDHGGQHLRTALLAVILSHHFELTPEMAIDLAVNDAFDDRVRAAGHEADRLIAQVRRTAQAIEYGESIEYGEAIPA